MSEIQTHYKPTSYSNTAELVVKIEILLYWLVNTQHPKDPG